MVSGGMSAASLPAMRRMLPLCGLLVACAVTPDTSGDDGLVQRVPGGKADDYYSTVALEFEVHGELPVEVPAGADEAAKREAAQRRIDAAVLYLTTYVTKKIEGFFTNLEYGGHAAMVRNRTAETLELVDDTSDDAVILRVANEATLEELDLEVPLDQRAAEGLVAGRPFETVAQVDAVPFVGESALAGMLTWGRARFGAGSLRVRFAVDVAGPRELPTLLGETFDLRMPKGATSDGEGSLGTVRSFDADRYTGELESVPCELVPIPAARNGYPEYTRYFEDGVFDITLFQGHDYNEARSDLIEALELVHTLDYSGFDGSAVDLLPEPDPTVRQALVSVLGDQADLWADLVDRVSRLHAGSGPFVKSLRVGDREIRAEARIFHSEMFRDDRAGQRELALAELAARDVFFYNGHAGPWYGFYLDAAGAAEVNEDDFARAALTDRAQLVVANGCQTYSQYADMLYAHEAKDESNLDVITTVNFSYGRGSDMLLGALTQTDAEGQHIAFSYGDLIRAFNQDNINDQYQVFYGVTGIDQNPKLHPYADVSAIGRPCTASTDCGNINGNVCGGTCGAVAVSPEGCPAGTTYAPFATDDTIAGGACWAEP